MLARIKKTGEIIVVRYYPDILDSTGEYKVESALDDRIFLRKDLDFSVSPKEISFEDVWEKYLDRTKRIIPGDLGSFREAVKYFYSMGVATNPLTNVCVTWLSDDDDDTNREL